MPDNGTYVELGAFDGSTDSNTRFFDRCLGWKGLLIEGNLASFDKMKEARPSAHKMSFAPTCSAEYEMVNKSVEFYKYPLTNSGQKGKAIITYEGKPTVPVPCGPLGPVLEDMFPGGQRINFFSLDVEGSEALVLRTIDFERVHIDVLMVEVENAHCLDDNCAVRQEVRSIMEQVGYKRYERIVRASDVYVRRGSEFELTNKTSAS
eukprot:Sro190_g082010.1 n/a (206) ;mRNA; f:89764-90381